MAHFVLAPGREGKNYCFEFEKRALSLIAAVGAAVLTGLVGKREE